MMSKFGAHTLLMTGATAATFVVLPVSATSKVNDATASAGSVEPPAPAAADPAVEPAADDADQLGKIVVPAARRETNLHRTPIAINVLSSKSLKDRHVQSLYDLADGAVPSLLIATFEARRAQ